MSRTLPQTETHYESPFSWAMLDAPSSEGWSPMDGGVFVSLLLIWLVPHRFPGFRVVNNSLSSARPAS
jgi:hypothetical protein